MTLGSHKVDKDKGNKGGCRGHKTGRIGPGRHRNGLRQSKDRVYPFQLDIPPQGGVNQNQRGSRSGGGFRLHEGGRRKMPREMVKFTEIQDAGRKLVASGQYPTIEEEFKLLNKINQ